MSEQFYLDFDITVGVMPLIRIRTYPPRQLTLKERRIDVRSVGLDVWLTQYILVMA